jgi:hypothetical protein
MLGQFFDENKIYLDTSIAIIIYPALSTTIGGQDGMDGGKQLWMTKSHDLPSILIVSTIEWPIFNCFLSLFLHCICILNANRMHL